MKILTPTEKRNQTESVMVEVFRIRVATAIHNSRRIPIILNLSGTSRDIVEIIMVEVREKGWKARIVDDSRDGDYLEIQE